MGLHKRSKQEQKRKTSRKTKWKMNRKMRKLFFEYMEYLSFAQTGPFCTSCPSPSNLIKRQSGDNQKCLKVRAINSSHMLNKCPDCRRDGYSVALREPLTLC